MRKPPKVPEAPKPPNTPTQASYLSRGSNTTRLAPSANRALPPAFVGSQLTNKRNSGPTLLGGTR
jgi:hypothetical protein